MRPLRHCLLGLNSLELAVEQAKGSTKEDQETDWKNRLTVVGIDPGKLPELELLGQRIEKSTEEMVVIVCGIVENARKSPELIDEGKILRSIVEVLRNYSTVPPVIELGRYYGFSPNKGRRAQRERSRTWGKR